MNEINSTPIEEQLSTDGSTRVDQSKEDAVTPVMFWGTIVQAVIMLLMTVAIAYLTFSGVVVPTAGQDATSISYLAVALVIVIAMPHSC